MPVQPRRPSYLYRIVTYIAGLLFGGTPSQEAERRAASTHPGIPVQEIRDALGLADLGVRAADFASSMDVGLPLRSALQGAEPPAERVSAYFRLSLSGEGYEMGWRTIRIDAPWDTPLSELLTQLRENLQQWLEQYPGLAVTDLYIAPPLIIPPSGR